MSGLPNDFVQEIKEKLIKQQMEVKKRIEELRSQDPFADVERLNDNAASDREAQEESGHDRVSALVIELASQGAAIENALEQIQNGTYGVCVTCGNLIETDRLQAFPTATKCITCQQNETN